MKVIAFLTAVLDIASVYSLEEIPSEVREVSVKPIRPKARIINGTKEYGHRFPFMILTLTNQPGGYIICSSSLIKPCWVLLAAHCFEKKKRRDGKRVLAVGGNGDLRDYMKKRTSTHFYTSITGAKFGVQERRGKALFVHPGYNTSQYGSRSRLHDIALLQLKEPFSSTTIKPIPFSEEKMREPKFCTILGWGLTAPKSPTKILHFVENVEVYTAEMGCEIVLGGAFICIAGTREMTLFGDSGSPLVCEGKVWGVCAHVMLSGDTKEDMYTEVFAHVKWFKSVFTYSEVDSVAKISSKGLLVCALAILWLFVKI